MRTTVKYGSSRGTRRSQITLLPATPWMRTSGGPLPLVTACNRHGSRSARRLRIHPPECRDPIRPVWRPHPPVWRVPFRPVYGIEVASPPGCPMMAGHYRALIDDGEAQVLGLHGWGQDHGRPARSAFRTWSARTSMCSSAASIPDGGRANWGSISPARETVFGDCCMRAASRITSCRQRSKTALPSLGIGITNLVDRVTAAADELDDEELRAGARPTGREGRRSTTPLCRSSRVPGLPHRISTTERDGR